MKRVSVENGKALIYINRLDLYTLVKIKRYLKDELFQEDSILKDECDDDGYYKIEEVHNVHYVRDLPFIPHYSYLLKFDANELNQMLDDAIKHSIETERLVAIPCDKYIPLDEEGESYLRSLEEVDQQLVEHLLSKDPDSEKEWIEICDISRCIVEEFNNYVRCVSEMLEQKQEQEAKVTMGTDTNPKGKRFSLKDFFGFIGK